MQIRYAQLLELGCTAFNLNRDRTKIQRDGPNLAFVETTTYGQGEDCDPVFETKTFVLDPDGNLDYYLEVEA